MTNLVAKMIFTMVSVAVSFIASIILTPYFIRFLRSIGMVNVDNNDKSKKTTPEMGGPIVLFGFLAGAFLFLWINTFLLGLDGITAVLGLIATALLATMVGMIDDLTLLSKRRTGGKRVGLKQWQKMLLTLPAAVPLMAIMAGNPVINLPIIGSVDVGLFYPLVLVPLGVVGATNAYNMLAGINGLEAGMGFVLLSSLGVFALIIGETTIGGLSLIFSFSLLGFLVYNWYPAKIFPGDSLTYLTGAVAVSIAILGNFEKFAAFCFIPWILEFFIKARSRFKAESFGVLQKDGTLKPREGIRSLTHVFMRGLKEWQVSLSLIIMELVVCVSAFVLYFSGLL
jgi:UDP-N-acetylglucosamine--dolichyl-phosphate N-acetylglucosaminephosphotransferase